MTSAPAPPLWRNGDFVRLVAAATVSQVGSFITRTALPFAAILVLGAGAGEVAILRGAEIVAGLTIGLVAGAWVDRLRRRPVMIWADLGRALLLGSIPVAFIAGSLTLAHLILVAFGAAVLTTFFDVADRAFLPTVIGRDRLVTANSTLTASSSAAEFAGFGAGGWLIQVLTAPIAIAIDAVSFVLSAILLGRIRTKEPAPTPPEDREPVLREIAAGLRLTLGHPILRPLALADASVAGFWGVFGAVYLVFVTEIGFQPAAIGLLAAVGGLSSIAGAVFAGRASRRLGVGRFLISAMVVVTIGNFCLALAPDATLIGVALLLAQQLLSDSSLTAFDVVVTSIRQASVDDRALGRVGASFHTLAMAFLLAGTVIGGVLAETLSVRSALLVGGAGGLLAIAILWFSAVRRMAEVPVGLDRLAGPVIAGEDVPLSE
ncbi:MAG: MFS transporter [Chloroflexota bacterium]|nr:MFS transporter [Chloroflexota bacterium]